MLQSVTVPDVGGSTYMALFPLNISFSDMRFHQLRGKGAFLVSAGWNASSRLAPPHHPTTDIRYAENQGISRDGTLLLDVLLTWARQ